MNGWPRSALISLLLTMLFLAACGVKGPPAETSGPWGPMENTPADRGQADDQPD